MRTKEKEKEYKEAMEWKMARDIAEQEVIEEIRNIQLDTKEKKECESFREIIIYWQSKLK